MMAIGFNLPGIPGQIRGTAEEAGAVPDLGQAMMQGFRSNIENVQGAPRLLSQQLLSNALSNKIRGVQAKYAEPMAKTGYDQALANLQHQGLINQYYGRMRESELSGQGLAQQHQRMVNDMLKRQIDRQKRYDELMELYQKQGATPDQAHTLATQAVDQTHPVAEQAPEKQPMQDLAQTILGAQMPDYLANIAPQEQPNYADLLKQTEGYSPISQPDFNLNYSPVIYGTEAQPTKQENLLQKALRKNEEMRQAGLKTVFGKPLKFALERQQKLYPDDLRIQQALQRLDNYGRPQALEPSITAQAAQSASPYQIEQPEQQYTSEIFRTEPSAQPAPEYLQRPEEAAMAMPEAQAVPTQAPAQAVEAPAQQSYAQQLQEAGFDTTNSNPVYAAADQVYLKNPNYRDLLKQEFPNIGIKQFNDFPRNRMITTETLPSGATRTRIMPLGGQEGGGALPYKALSPYGKAVEDLKHYMDTGDLQSAEGAKRYVDSILEKEGKTQTGFDKAYKEWQNATQEYGPESKQAKDYRSRVESLMRGSQTIQLNKGFPITNPETGEQGYAYPQSKEEKLISGGRAAFNYIYPRLEEGVKPFSGTITQTTTALANAVKNQNVSKEAAKQLENFLLADKIRQSGAIKELRLIGGGMFKKTLEAITNTLANDQIQKDIKNFTKNNLINRDIQIRVNKRFKDILNGMSDAELKAMSEYVPIFPSQVSLKNNIKQGLKKPIANKNNQLKSRTTEPDVIVVTPEMVKGL